jgi:hypothetical protein
VLQQARAVIAATRGFKGFLNETGIAADPRFAETLLNRMKRWDTRAIAGAGKFVELYQRHNARRG